MLSSPSLLLEIDRFVSNVNTATSSHYFLTNIPFICWLKTTNIQNKSGIFKTHKIPNSRFMLSAGPAQGFLLLREFSLPLCLPGGSGSRFSAIVKHMETILYVKRAIQIKPNRNEWNAFLSSLTTP